MHLYCITRGLKSAIDEFINQLQGQYLPFEVKEGAAGLKKGKYNVQVQVRPIQMWEIVFPREHKDIKLATDLGEDAGTPHHSKFKKFVWGLRKVLGVKPIPKYDSKLKLPCTAARKHTEFVGIGIKEDYNFEDGTEAL